MRAPTFSIEVITLPVSDVDRALRFYVDQVGFAPGLDPTRGDYASFAKFSDRMAIAGCCRSGATPTQMWLGGEQLQASMRSKADC